MKKLFGLMLGLALVIGTTGLFANEDKKEEPKKEEKKKSKKKKTEEKK